MSKRRRTIRNKNPDSYRHAQELMDVALERRPEATQFQFKTKATANAMRADCYTFRNALLNSIRAQRRAEMEKEAEETGKLFVESDAIKDPLKALVAQANVDLELDKLTTPYHDLWIQSKEEDGKFLLRMSFENPRSRENLVAILDEKGRPLE